jgi:ferredoxin
MTAPENGPWRLFFVDEDRCIGCRACSSLWTEISSVLALSEGGPKRTIRFPRALEEFEARIAEALAEVCPTRAISAPLADALPADDSFSLVFEMVRCRRCRTPFATGKELDYIRGKLPGEIKAESSYPSWIDLCPACRRSAFREAASKDLIVRRSGARR